MLIGIGKDASRIHSINRAEERNNISMLTYIKEAFGKIQNTFVGERFSYQRIRKWIQKYVSALSENTEAFGEQSHLNVANSVPLFQLPSLWVS